MDPQQPCTAADWRRRLAPTAGASGAELCVLFGSRATGGGAPGSDVDLALLYRPLPPPERRLEIIGRLQSATDPVPVDVVFLHRDTDPVLRFEIFRAGQPLFEATPDRMVEERVRALMLYEDALPMRRWRREALRRVT